MSSNFDLLREGKTIEFEPGVYGRLNQKNKTLELSTGEVLNAANDRDFFPQGENALSLSRKRESIEKGIKGNIGEFFHQYTNQGLPGSAKDIFSYITQKGDDYAINKQANQQVSERISKESPYISGAATAANFATDMALTRGMSAFKAAPLLTVGSAGSKILTDPGEVATEALMSAGLGAGFDKTTGYLNRITQRRGDFRALPGQQAQVKAKNILGKQAAEEANAAQKQSFNALKEDVRNVNETRLKQYQDELTSRKNKIIQDQKDFALDKAARDAEVTRLKNEFETAKFKRSADQVKKNNEYKMAKQSAERQNKALENDLKVREKQYKSDLAKLPEMQKNAQSEYSANVMKNAEGISNSFPKDSRINTSQFGVGDFIDESINKGALAGSREGTQASKILKSIFPEGEILTGKELSKRYKSLEGAIQKSSPEVKEVLNSFKTHMGERLSPILSDNIAYSRIIPTMQKQIEKEVYSVLNSMQLAQSGIMSRPWLMKRAENNLNQIFREISPEDFINKMQSGEIRQKILKNILNPEDFTQNLAGLKPRGNATPLSREEAQKLGIKLPITYQQKYDEFSNFFGSKLDKALAKAELKMIGTDVDAANKLGAKVKKTYGVAPPIAEPTPPLPNQSIPLPSAPLEAPPIPPPQMPRPLLTPKPPSLPSKPDLMSQPTQPLPKSFNPLPEPNLPPPQGFAERTGDLLEKNLLGGKGLINNPLTKLAGLKYALGSAALPVEAAYLGMKGLTSPTAGGELARMTFKQAGIEAIESWAENYPSYHDGILEDPQERRSLTKEIEDDASIPLEQKAVIQSKINRGKPIQQKL